MGQGYMRSHRRTSLRSACGAMLFEAEWAFGCGGKPTVKNRMPDYFAEVHPKIRAFMLRSLVSQFPDDEFNSLALELFHAQKAANVAYARLCDAWQVKNVSHWTEIPCAPTAA